MFEAFPKMGRLYREIIITEKIDGTNAQVLIGNPNGEDADREPLAVVDGLGIWAGSRTKFIGIHDDNFGFANWVLANAAELVKLGEGRHFGEWWGKGIQRGYGLDTRKFSLFNTTRWYDDMEHKKLCPDVCDVVPLLYKGVFDEAFIKRQIEQLKKTGSYAAPGFMKPEGIITYHTAAGVGFKTTLDNDQIPKGLAQ